MGIAKKAYGLCAHFPTEEKYGLQGQIRRSAVSIPSNIAEGSQRTSDKEFAHFILIAKGSLAELETQFLLAQSFEYLKSSVDDFLREIDELQRMLYNFHKRLKSQGSA